MKCFNCGTNIINSSVPCPKCGYKFSADDTRYCPNSTFGLCTISEIPCTYGVGWQTCPVKVKADNESEF